MRPGHACGTQRDRSGPSLSSPTAACKQFHGLNSPVLAVPCMLCQSTSTTASRPTSLTQVAGAFLFGPGPYCSAHYTSVQLKNWDLVVASNFLGRSAEQYCSGQTHIMMRSVSVNMSSLRCCGVAPGSFVTLCNISFLIWVFLNIFLFWNWYCISRHDSLWLGDL